MRLVYYKSEPNVGDALNPWLWSRLLGDLLDEDRDHILLGIGTILVRGYEGDARKITVFGSGARSRRTLPDFAKAEWDLRFVRGPRTSHLTGAPFMSDPAILLPLLLPPSRSQKGVGFVPHFKTRSEIATNIASKLGARVISPTLGVEDFVRELTGCAKVICEAMHGAIIADAYGVPWTCLRVDVGFKAGASNVFKWLDWCESLGVSYSADPLPLVCYAPYFVRKHFRPANPKVPKNFAYDLSPRSELDRAQGEIMEQVEKLKQCTS